MQRLMFAIKSDRGCGFSKLLYHEVGVPNVTGKVEFGFEFTYYPNGQRSDQYRQKVQMSMKLKSA